MRIFKISAPLPLDVIPEYRGEFRVDKRLSNKEVEFLTKKFKLIGSLGGGYWGIAYETADGKVLKITADEGEMEISAQLMLGAFKYGPFASVYDIGVIGKDDGLAILKEKVTPLSEHECVLFTQARDEHYGRNKEYHSYNGFDFSEADRWKINQFKEYIKDVVTYPLYDTTNETNVGYNKSGMVVCFDPSY